MLLLAWTTFAFGGVYLSALIVPACLVVVLALMFLPPAGGRGTPHSSGSRLDAGPAWSLAAMIVILALQLVPLPASLVRILSPHAWTFREQFRLAPQAGWMPLTIDGASTIWALGVVIGVVLVFVASRAIFEIGGTRVAVRGVSGTGLILAAVSLAQDATAHGLMYWRWKPIEEGAPPFGPFVDRNHFATWAVLAIPLCLGYLVAHASAHRQRMLPGASWHRAVLHALDARAIWLTASVVLMLVALVATLSRSGLVGLGAAVLTGWWLRAARPDGSAAGRWIGAAAALALLAAVIRVNPVVVMHRFGAAGTAAIDRFAIWGATMPIVRNFWLAGTGAGTFETAMLVYQPPGSAFRINAAHNHYLQLAAEGGLLLAIPTAAAAIAFLNAAVARLREDQSGMYGIRAGAVCGLIGVAVQSLWETGLTTPANGVLAAMAAAVAVHRAGPHHHG